MAKVNWTQLKREYIGDQTVSYADLSKKHGISETAIAVRASKEKWTDARKLTLEKVNEKLIEKTGEKIAEFQAEKLKVGKYMISRGLTALQQHEPRNARESKEVVEIGYKLATEAMELDKQTQAPSLTQVVINMTAEKGTEDVIIDAASHRIPSNN